MEKNKEEIVDSVKIVDTDFYDYDNDEYNDSDDVEEKEEWNTEELEQHLFETAFTIQNNLFDYVNAFALPLCEKLDVDDIIEFIKQTN